jgi:PAS domain S-box-containing protein
MGSGEVIAIVDADLARRVAAVEALGERGYRAFGIGSIDRLKEDGRVPALIVVYANDRADLDDCVLTMKDDARLVALPLFVVAGEESGVTAQSAFDLGAVDFVGDHVELSELEARIAARLSGHRRVRRLSKERESAEALLELTRALSSTLELREILYIVVRRIADVVDTDRVSIVLGGLDDETAYVIAASDDEKLRDLPIQLRKYPEIKRVLDTGQPLIVEDAHAHPLFHLSEAKMPERFRSLVLMPIRFEDRTMGVLFLRFEQSRALSEDDDLFLRAIANASGIALRNASLLHSLRDQSKKEHTAHVEAERQLKALQRYVDFFDSCADGILVITLDGEVLFCNPAACIILGRSEQELRAAGLDDILTRDGRKIFAGLQSSFADGIFPNAVDLPVRTGDGRRRVLNVSFSSVLHEHRGVIVSLRDVTDDRATARELTKTKEFLQRVIDSSVDAIVSADMRGNVLLFNPAAERTYGYSADEVVGKVNVSNLYPEGVAREVMSRIRSSEYNEAGTLQGFETELLGKGGRRVPVMLSAALIVHRGRAIGSVGVFKDLRARLQIEERLRDAQKDLAEKEQKAFIAELAGATAHELNQPLTTVMGYAGMLEAALTDDARLSRASAAIVRETERMAEIVRKIGKLTKYESKSYVGDTKIIDIERSIDSEPPVTGI